MKKRITVLTAFILMISLCIASAPVYVVNSISEEETYTIKDDFSDDCILVVLKPDYSEINKVWTVKDFPDIGAIGVDDLSTLSKEVLEVYQMKESYKQILRFNVKAESKQAILNNIDILMNSEYIESASPNTRCQLFATPNDTYYGGGQFYYPFMSIDDAWDISTGSSSTKVGLIDSGITVHSDLTSNVVRVWDFINDNSTTTDDVFGHGTFISGIIGADTNNSLGIAGVNWDTSIVPLQAGDDYGYLEYDDVIEAITYAQDNYITILNMSFGSYDDYPPLYTKIQQYTGLCVCAAGNSGFSFPSYPARYNLDNIISVGNSTFTDYINSNSNYSTTEVDIAAVGTYVYSTFINNSYYTWSGTSFSAPLITGTAALIKSERPDLSPVRIKNCILDGADTVASLSNYIVNGRRLNAADALELALVEDMYGDVNEDGEINGVDSMLLSQYLAGQPVMINLTLADTNNDGDVSAKDKLLLLRYLSGVATYLGPNS